MSEEQKKLAKGYGVPQEPLAQPEGQRIDLRPGEEQNAEGTGNNTERNTQVVRDNR